MNENDILHGKKWEERCLTATKKTVGGDRKSMSDGSCYLILNLDTMRADIREDFAPEEQQESYDLCKEICDELLNKGI